MNILVKVNFNVRESLVKALADDGYEVFPVSCFSDARQVYYESEIDFIIIDLHSDVSGLEKEYPKAKGSDGSGNFSGYVWLKHYIFDNWPNQERKTIIFCQGHYHLEEFKQRFSGKELEGLTIVDYLACSGPHNSFIDVIKNKLAKLKETE